MSGFEIRPIARIESDFDSPFGIPRQAGIVGELCSKIVFEPEYRNDDALRGIEGYSHIWLIWQFSENLRAEFSPTVRPPRLGGNMRMGVFATRSPFRPNSLGLSCVRLLGLEKTENSGTVLCVGGADLMNGTPIFDIKPYIPYSDCIPDALEGFAPAPEFPLDVSFAPGTEDLLPPGKLDALKKVLSCDPRPHYQKDPDRLYGMSFSGYNIQFKVNGSLLSVVAVTPPDGAAD